MRAKTTCTISRPAVREPLRLEERAISALLVAACLLLVSPDLAAAERQEQGQAAESQQLTLEEVVQKVQQKTDGRILSADSMRRGTNYTYRIKLLTNDGRVRVAEVDSDKELRLDWLAPEAQPEKENK